MITALALLACSLTSLFAQSNSEYKFRQQSTVVGDRYSSEDAVPRLTMNCLAANGYGQWSLSSTAGPLIGTGALGFMPAYTTGWYLLANGLYKPSSYYATADTSGTHPGCIPPGVVQNAPLGEVSEPTEPKATANLDGTSAYVWPHADPSGNRLDFTIRTFVTSDVDLSFDFCKTPTATTRRDVVASGPATNHASTTDPLVSQPHCPIRTGDFRDRFDVASDAHFIYIVWCSDTNISDALIGATNEIWLTVLPIGSSTAVSGYPKSRGAGIRPTVACNVRQNRGASPSPLCNVAFITQASAGGTIKYKNVSGAGTITITNQPIAPTFVNPTNCLLTGSMGYPKHVRALVNGTTSALYAICDYSAGSALFFWDPVSSTNADWVDGFLTQMTLPQPAGATGQPATNSIDIVDEPIIAVVDPYDNPFHCLYQINATFPKMPSPVTRNPIVIVRGSDNGTAHTSSCTSTTDTRLVLNAQGGTLLQDAQANASVDASSAEWYVAAVNQMGIRVHWTTSESGGKHYYARDTSRAFDEDIEENTLVTDICTVSDGTARSNGTVGARILQNRTMAIWTDPNYGFSATDMNTGLWQPRTFTTTSAASIAPLDAHVGMLNFIGEDVSLNVGGASESVTGDPGRLTDVPYFFFNFLGASRGVTQKVTVHGKWDYYGLLALHDAEDHRSTIIASPFTNGSLAGDPAASGSDIQYVVWDNGGGNIEIATYTDNVSTEHPGLLNVHGGSNFNTSEWTSLVVEPSETNLSGNIDVLYDGNVFPADSSLTPLTRDAVTDRHDTTGLLRLNGKVRLHRHTALSSYADWASNWALGGCLRAHIPWYDDDVVDPTLAANYDYFATEVVMHVDQGYDKEDQVEPTQFYSHDFSYFNVDPNATAELRFGHYDPQDSAVGGDGGDISFDGGLADAINIHVIDPYPGELNTSTSTLRYNNAYTVQNMVFNDLRGYVINIENDQEFYIASWGGGYPPAGYPSVTISNNHFKNFSANAGIPLDWFTDPSEPEERPTSGINVKNFDGVVLGSLYPENLGIVSIDNNEFVNSGPDPNFDNDDLHAAISLINSTANVRNNKITWNMWPIGIRMNGANLSTTEGPPRTLSFVCSNDIENLNFWYPKDVAPIVSSYSGGYVKLNTLLNNTSSYHSMRDDEPNLIFNDMEGHGLYGIYLSLDHDKVKMSGVHGATSSGDDYAAFNTVKGPTRLITSSVQYPALMYIDRPTSTATSTSSRIELSNTWENWSHWSNYGHNNLIVTSAFDYPAEPLIQAHPSLSAVNIGSTNANYFEGLHEVLNPSLGASNWSPTSHTGEIDVNNITYTASSHESAAFLISRDFGEVSCGTGWETPVQRSCGIKALNMADLPDTTCRSLYARGDSYEGARWWQMGYDTLKKYVENCPHDESINFAFYSMTQCANHLGIGGQYFEWLKSVLYLNTRDPEYFCSVVEEIAGELPHPDHLPPGVGYNYPLTIDHWLLMNTDCDSAGLAQLYRDTRRSQYQDWFNSGKSYMLDTTLLPLSTWGLDTLFAKHFQLQQVKRGPDILTSITTNPNPALTGTTITFNVSQAAYVKVEVYDLLGNAVRAGGFEQYLGAGNHSVPIDLTTLASGTYYARIVTAYGETRTVKIARE